MNITSNMQNYYGQQTSLLTSLTGQPAAPLSAFFPKKLGIVKLNNDLERLYNKESFRNVRSLIQRSFELNQAARKFTNYGLDNRLNYRVGESSSSAVTVENVRQGAEIRTHRVSVSQLAESQVNTSDSVNSTATNNFSEGINKINIQFEDGDTSSFQVKVLATDTNKQVLEKMEKSINESNTGLLAEIKIDQTNGTSFLELTSKNTGTRNSFTFSDETGNLSSNLNLNNITNQSQDSIYTANGSRFVSSSNTVYIGNGKVKLQLNATTSQETEINVNADTNSMKFGISSLVQSLNQFFKYSDFASDYLGGYASSLINKMSNESSAALSMLGVSEDENGKLSINQEEFENYFEEIENNPSKLSELVSSFNNFKGLANSISYKTEQLMTTPIQKLMGDNPYTEQKYRIQREANADKKLAYMQQQYYMMQTLMTNKGNFVSDTI